MEAKKHVVVTTKVPEAAKEKPEITEAKPAAGNVEEKKDDSNEEVKETEAKRAKLDQEVSERKAEDGLDQELKDMRDRNMKIFFVFDIGTPSAIFIKMVDFMRPHIDVKKIGLAIIDHIKTT